MSGTELELLQPSRNCEICAHPATPGIEMSYVKKLMSGQDVIDAFKDKGLEINRSKWYTHVKYHLKPDVVAALSENAAPLAGQVVDKVHTLIQHIDLMKEKVDSYSNNINSDSDAGTIKAFTALAAELRHTITDLAKIQGEFSDVALVQVNNYKVEVINLQEIIMQEACPMCKPKFIKRLEAKVVKRED